MGKNYKGEDIKYPYPILRKDEYGTGKMNRHGFDVDWENNVSEFTDEDGFDRRFEKVTVTLPKGTKIIRYGYAEGRYTAPLGTPYEMLSLPYVKESLEYHQYTVKQDTEVQCVVIAGIVGEGFEQVGGGLQYMHEMLISELVESGVLEEDKLW